MNPILKVLPSRLPTFQLDFPRGERAVTFSSRYQGAGGELEGADPSAIPGPADPISPNKPRPKSHIRRRLQAPPIPSVGDSRPRRSHLSIRGRSGWVRPNSVPARSRPGFNTEVRSDPIRIWVKLAGKPNLEYDAISKPNGLQSPRRAPSRTISKSEGGVNLGSIPRSGPTGSNSPGSRIPNPRNLQVERAPIAWTQSVSRTSLKEEQSPGHNSDEGGAEGIEGDELRGKNVISASGRHVALTCLPPVHPPRLQLSVCGTFWSSHKGLTA